MAAEGRNTLLFRALLDIRSALASAKSLQNTLNGLRAVSVGDSALMASYARSMKTASGSAVLLNTALKGFKNPITSAAVKNANDYAAGLERAASALRDMREGIGALSEGGKSGVLEGALTGVVAGRTAGVAAGAAAVKEIGRGYRDAARSTDLWARSVGQGNVPLKEQLAIQRRLTAESKARTTAIEKELRTLGPAENARRVALQRQRRDEQLKRRDYTDTTNVLRERQRQQRDNDAREKQRNARRAAEAKAEVRRLKEYNRVLDKRDNAVLARYRRALRQQERQAQLERRRGSIFVGGGARRRSGALLSGLGGLGARSPIGAASAVGLSGIAGGGAVFGAVLGATLSVALIAASDQIRRLRSQIRLVAPATRATERELRDMAIRTRSNFESVVTVFARTSRAIQSLDPSIPQARVERFTEAVTRLVRISGSGPREASTALIQLSQGLASNRLGGEELRSVMEQVPAIAIRIARGMGITLGELREISRLGRLEAVPVMKAILSQVDDIEGEFQSIDPLVSDIAVTLWDQVKATAALADQAFNVSDGWSYLLARARDLLVWYNRLADSQLNLAGPYTEAAAEQDRLDRLAERDDGLTFASNPARRAAFENAARFWAKTTKEAADYQAKKEGKTYEDFAREVLSSDGQGFGGFNSDSAGGVDVLAYLREISAASNKAVREADPKKLTTEELRGLRLLARENNARLNFAEAIDARYPGEFSGAGQTPTLRAYRERNAEEQARLNILLRQNEARRARGDVDRAATNVLRDNIRVLQAETRARLDARELNLGASGDLDAVELRRRTEEAAKRLAKDYGDIERGRQQAARDAQVASLRQRAENIRAAVRVEKGGFDAERELAKFNYRAQLKDVRAYYAERLEEVKGYKEDEDRLRKELAGAENALREQLNFRLGRVDDQQREAFERQLVQLGAVRPTEVGKSATESLLAESAAQLETVKGRAEELRDALSTLPERDRSIQETEIDRRLAKDRVQINENTTERLKTLYRDTWISIGREAGSVLRSWRDNTENWIALLVDTLPSIVRQFKELADAARALNSRGVNTPSQNFFGRVQNFFGRLFGGARAYGGPVASGKAYLVGERGPELFLPGQSGRVEPDAAGGNVIVNLPVVDLSGDVQAQLTQFLPLMANAALERVQGERL